MTDLNDEVAVVTSRTRGIGRAVAEQLAELGATVVATYHEDEANAEQIAAALADTPVEATVEQFNVADYDVAAATFDTFAEHYEPPTVLVNNVREWAMACCCR